LKDNEELGFPADMYLEASDQHRGWFQSSLLTSVALYACSPTCLIATHEHTVDEHGKKMSKSRGNVVAPQEVIDRIGTDGLRLWVASVGIPGEPSMGQTIEKNVGEVFRKIRNSCRFLLSNLYDFDIEKDAVPFSDMRVIDQHALHKLYLLNYDLLAAYDAHDYSTVYHKLGAYCAVDLSAEYLDIIKDRLYVEQANGPARRSAQTACWYILDTLTRLMAPVLSFTAEQVSDLYQKNKQESIHLQPFAQLPNVLKIAADRKIFEQTTDNVRWSIPEGRLGMLETFRQIKHMRLAKNYDERWSMLFAVRDAVLKAIEGLREQKVIKHSLEAGVILHVTDNAAIRTPLQTFIGMLQEKGEDAAGFLKEFFIVSHVDLVDKPVGSESGDVAGLFIQVEQASGYKCPRCWQWDETDHADLLCRRCQRVLD